MNVNTKSTDIKKHLSLGLDIPTGGSKVKRPKGWRSLKSKQTGNSLSLEFGNDAADPYVLTTQSLESLLRELASNNVTKMSHASGFSTDRRSRASSYPIINPINIHLLTAQVGPATRDLADYISKETVGKCFVPSGKSSRESSLLALNRIKRFRRKSNIHLSKFNLPYPLCRRTIHKRDTDTNRDSSLEKHLFTTHQLQRRNRQLKRTKTVRKKIRKPFQQPLPYSDPEVQEDLWTANSLTVDLLLEDFDESDEDDVPSEEELMMQLNPGESHDTESLRLPSQTKSTFSVIGTGNEQAWKGMSDVILSLRNLSMTSLAGKNMDEKTCFLRLIYAMNRACTPDLIIARGRKRNRIVYDISQMEFSKAYSPQILRDLRCRLLQTWHTVNFTLNDRENMEGMTETMKDLYRKRFLRMEYFLKRKEYERLRAIILRDMTIKDVFNAELRHQGEVVHQKRRKDPVILLPKRFRQRKELPVFCINPLREEYIATYNTQQSRVKLKQHSKGKGRQVSFVGKLIGGGSRTDSRSTYEQAQEDVEEDYEDVIPQFPPARNNLHKSFLPRLLQPKVLPTCLVDTSEEGKVDENLVTTMYSAAAALLDVKELQTEDQSSEKSGVRSPVSSHSNSTKSVSSDLIEGWPQKPTKQGPSGIR